MFLDRSRFSCQTRRRPAWGGCRVPARPPLSAGTISGGPREGRWGRGSTAASCSPQGRKGATADQPPCAVQSPAAAHAIAGIALCGPRRVLRLANPGWPATFGERRRTGAQPRTVQAGHCSATATARHGVRRSASLSTIKHCTSATRALPCTCRCAALHCAATVVSHGLRQPMNTGGGRGGVEERKGVANTTRQGVPADGASRSAHCTGAVKLSPHPPTSAHDQMIFLDPSSTGSVQDEQRLVGQCWRP